MIPETGTLCIHFRVQGNVQGVFFRASSAALARQLGLSGWVRNTENGEVELLACGAAPALKTLQEWLWQGPANARVTDVMATPAPWQTLTGFDVLR